jgi:NTP pyrophosphatase (non-canonical NTP hydrolase)
VNEHFNRLTPSQAERLAVLAEECGETVKAIGKILRHGYESVNPDVPNHEGNRKDLARECGDLLAAIDMLAVRGDIFITQVMDAKRSKLAKVWRYMHHQTRISEDS